MLSMLGSSTALSHINVLHNKMVRAMAYTPVERVFIIVYSYNSLRSMASITFRDKFRHSLHSGVFLNHLDQLYIPVNEVHLYAIRSAARGGYWQSAQLISLKTS